MTHADAGVIFLGLAAEGFAFALLGFPLAWIGMPKKLKSERFWDAKWGYCIAVLLVPVLTALGAFGLKDSSKGSEPSAIAPFLALLVCVLLVFWTREKTKIPP